LALGELLAERRFVAAARAEFERAAAAAPGHPEVRALLASALLAEGRLADAEREYREVVRLAPGHAPALTRLSLLLWRRGAAAEAIGFGERAVAADPGSGPRRAGLGLVLAAAGRPDEARRAFADAARLDPGWADRAARGGLAAAANPGPPGALFLAECQARAACEAAGYAHPGFLLGLAAVVAAQGRFPEAADLLEKARPPADRMGDAGLLRVIDEQLARYKAGRPLRDPAPGPVKTDPKNPPVAKIPG
jgi:tetratricopeptide (TPR) repeat protein